MSLFKVNDFSNFDTVFKNISKIGDELSKGVTFETGGFNPRVNIMENQDGISVLVELAGVNKEDVSISVNDDNLLTIKGERKQNIENQGRNFLRREIIFGEFSRSFLLPEYLDTEKIKAKFNDGVLEIMVLKKEEIAPKEINVQII